MKTDIERLVGLHEKVPGLEAEWHPNAGHLIVRFDGTIRQAHLHSSWYTWRDVWNLCADALEAADVAWFERYEAATGPAWVAKRWRGTKRMAVGRTFSADHGDEAKALLSLLVKVMEAIA